MFDQLLSHSHVTCRMHACMHADPGGTARRMLIRRTVQFAYDWYGMRRERERVELAVYEACDDFLSVDRPRNFLARKKKKATFCLCDYLHPCARTRLLISKKAALGEIVHVHVSCTAALSGRRQGNMSAPQTTGKDSAPVNSKTNKMHWLILLGDIQWRRVYLQSMVIMLPSLDVCWGRWSVNHC